MEWSNASLLQQYPISQLIRGFFIYSKDDITVILLLWIAATFKVQL